VDKLIDVCTRKLTTDATNTRALLIRASSYVKRGACPSACVRWLPVARVLSMPLSTVCSAHGLA
jgi:hypothetical protein